MRHEKRIGKQRKRRSYRVRNRIKHDATRPRLSVFRSGKHIYAQVIDDEQGKTLAAAGTLDKDLRKKVSYGGNIEAAKVIGAVIAERAIAAGVKEAVFDRREYKYHGRVAALADAARDAGLGLGAKGAAPEPAPEKKPAKKSKSKSKKSEKK